MANHRRETSIPHIRLTQPLPSLPMNDFPPRLSILTQIPYHDDPAEDEELEGEGPEMQQSPSQPPQYEPMYDYLRSQQRPNLQPPIHDRENNTISIAVEEPYRDEPFVITIAESEVDTNQPPPPSYHELYQPSRDIELRNLIEEFDLGSSPAEQTEELYKWVVAMLLIALTIAGVGTAFNWGRPSCQWPNNTTWKC